MMKKETGLIHVACEANKHLPVLYAEVGRKADIVECGCELILTKGVSAIADMKANFPDKEVVADLKMTPLVAYHQAGLLFNSGADAIIITGSKLRREMEPVMDIARKMKKKVYVCIEVESDGVIDTEMLGMYQDIGVTNLIYHSYKLSAPFWTEDDVVNVEKLVSFDFDVSVTGHLSVEAVAMFGKLHVYSFIIGAGIMEAENPSYQLDRYREAIK